MWILFPLQGAGQGGSFAAFLAVPPLIDVVKRQMLTSYSMGAVLALLAVFLLFIGRLIDRKRESQKEKDDSEKAAVAASIAEEDGAARAAQFENSGVMLTPRSVMWRFLNSRILKFLGFHHLYGLSPLFWCYLTSIAMYSGSYFTFLG